MTSAITDAALALGDWIELSILSKATVILVLGLTAARLAGRARAKDMRPWSRFCWTAAPIRTWKYSVMEILLLWPRVKDNWPWSRCCSTTVQA